MDAANQSMMDIPQYLARNRESVKFVMVCIHTSWVKMKRKGKQEQHSVENIEDNKVASVSCASSRMNFCKCYQLERGFQEHPML